MGVRESTSAYEVGTSYGLESGRRSLFSDLIGVIRMDWRKIG